MLFLLHEAYFILYVMLSIIITTSAIRSHPSTHMIDKVIASLHIKSTWQVIIICDGYRLSTKDTFELKRGVITEQQAQHYLQYIENLRTHSPANFTIIVRERRYGFAKNVRYALEQCIFEYALIVQHDFMFVEAIDFEQLLEQHFIEGEQINYLTFKSNGKDNKTNYIEQNTPLLPLLFLYDRNHLVRKSFYLEYVFKQYRVKNFIEDSFGHTMKTMLKENMAHFALFKTYMLNSPDLIVRHIDGRGRN